MLPREGGFLRSIENMRGTLPLVDFGIAGSQYLFPHEIEPEKMESEQQMKIDERKATSWSTKSF